MKTERRHELQSNVLAGQLGKLATRVSPYTKWLGWAALAVALVLFAVAIWSYFQNRESATAWQEYMQAMAGGNSRTALQDLATTRPRENVGIWAHLTVADSALAEGSQQIYRNREEAERLLNDAKESYTEVVEAKPDSVFLKQRAQFGLGQAHEVLGALKNARKHYEQVVELGADTALGKQAQEQLDLINQTDVREFYDWFAQQRDIPRGPGGLNLEGLNNLPNSPDFNIDELLNRTTPSGETPSDQPGSPADSTDDFSPSILNEPLDPTGEGTPEATETSDTDTPAQP